MKPKMRLGQTESPEKTQDEVGQTVDIDMHHRGYHTMTESSRKGYHVVGQT
jgi:hypothetical protein